MIFTSLGFAATVTVGATDSLSQAVENAAPGDLLVLEGDVYDEVVVIDKELRILGVPDRTLLTSSGNHVLDITGDAHVVLVNLHISGATERLAIRTTTGDVELDNVRISASAGNDVSAQIWRATGRLAMIQSELRWAQSGGVAVIGTFEGWDATLSGNQNYGAGSAIRMDGSTPVVRLWDSSLGGNESQTYGSAIYAGNGTLELVRTLVSDNTEGSAVQIGSADATFEQSVFKNNPGGIFMDGPGSLTIRESAFCGNDNTSSFFDLPIAISVGAAVDVVFEGNVVIHGGWDSYPSVILPSSSEIRNSTFIGNREAAALSIGDGATVEGSLFTQSGTGVDGAVTWAGANAFFDNTTDATPDPTGTLIVGDPAIEPGDPWFPCQDVNSPAGLSFDPTTSSLWDGSAWLASHAAWPATSCTEITVYRDFDGDGAGDLAHPYTACDVPTGLYVADSSDCDDIDPLRFPANPEICDGIDNDCNGTADDGPIGPFWQDDADADGFGDPASTVQACEAPAGTVDNASDCNDTDGSIHPDAPEVDCDGTDNDCNLATLDGPDGDLDGHLACPGLDCDDTDPAVNPGATERCNFSDDDCDGDVDEDLPLTTYYSDADGDGFGVEGTDVTTCDEEAQPGYAVVSGDCDDAEAAVFPGADDLTVCDGVDNDCDTIIDNPADSDGDGFLYCEDCDDADDTRYPDAPEQCDGIDNSCDEEIDEGLTFIEVWFDADGDGYGAGAAVSRCDEVAGYVDNHADCDDTNAAAYPGAAEGPGDPDLDCDGVLIPAEEPEPTDDLDGDGFAMGTDCDDGDPETYPGAPEDHSPVDRDCDGFTDPVGSLVAGCSTLGSGTLTWGVLALALLRRRP